MGGLDREVDDPENKTTARYTKAHSLSVTLSLPGHAAVAAGSCPMRRGTISFMTHLQHEFDIAVIGGGVVGAAIAWGLARSGQRVGVLDEGDVALRASRGNFALVWVQSKGLGLAPYSAWTMRSSNAWAGFAEELKQQTGVDVAFQRPGGFY